MLKLQITILGIFIFFLNFIGYNQVSSKSIQHFKTLCSENIAGRGYINDGLYKAEKYIVSYLKDSLNFQPYYLSNSFTQSFTHPVNTFPNNLEILLITNKKKKLVAGKDFIVHPASASINLKAKIYLLDTVNFNSKLELHKIISQLSKNTILVCKPNVSENKIYQKEIIHYFNRNFKKKCVIFLQNKVLTWGVLPFQFSNCFINILEDKWDYQVNKIKVKLEAKFIPNFESKNIITSNQPITLKDTCIIICAHYDHLGKMGQNTTFYGANDNASGIVMLLDLAQKFSQNQTKYPLIFIAFAAEEVGLLGSKFFVENLPKDLNIKLVINLDMVSAGEKGLAVANANNNEIFFNLLNQINEEENYLPQIISKKGTANSDHYFFHEKGIPSLFLYALGNYTHYHDLNDKFENLNLNYYPKTLNLISDFILKINGRDKL